MREENYDITYEDLNPTFLFSCTLSRDEDETNYHSHDFIELVTILKGERIFYIDGKEYETKEGDLLILNPGTLHKSLLGHTTSPASLECYISFTDVCFHHVPRNHMPLFPTGNLLLSMPAKMKQEIFKICQSISMEYGSCRTGRYFMVKAYLIQMICLILREQASPEQPAAGEGCVFKSINKKYVVDRIMSYLDSHYTEKVSLDKIAQNMYLSTFYISKIFKTETGDTPINYLISLRMEKAKELLESAEVSSVQDAAARVGYEDVSYFSKLFKKYHGFPPSKCITLTQA